MKLNVKSLQSALGACEFVYAGVKTTLTDAYNICIEPESSSHALLRAAGINGAAISIVTAECSDKELEAKQPIILAYQDLLLAVKNATSEVIEVKQKDKYILFVAGRTRAKCSCGTGAMDWDFNSPYTEITKLDKKEVFPKLQYLSKFASTDELRPQLCGVSIFITEEYILGFATDQQRAAKSVLKHFHSAPKEYWGTTMLMDQRMPSAMEYMDETITIGIRDGDILVMQDDVTTVYFRMPNTSLSFAQADGIYKAADSSDFDMIVVQGQEFVKTVARGLSFLKGGSNSMAQPVEFVQGGLRFVQEETGKVWREDYDAIKFEDEETVFKMNAALMMVLGSIKGEVCIKFRRKVEDYQSKPVVAESHDSDIQMLFMPINGG
jgi:hypothetical protein